MAASDAFSALPPGAAFAAATVSGSVTFVALLAAGQRLVLSPLRLAAHHRRTAGLVGSVVVAASGAAAGAVFSAATAALADLPPTFLALSGNSTASGPRAAHPQTQHTGWWGAARAARVGYDGAVDPPGDTLPSLVAALRRLGDAPAAERLTAAADVGRVATQHATAALQTPAGVSAAAALVQFWVLGGRGWRLAPSCLRHPGAFSRTSVPAKGAGYASEAQRAVLKEMGQRHGCHTCGTRRAALYHGDHMPPNHLAKPGQTQRFYPQCVTCSNMQGGTMLHARAPRVSHATRLRLYHLWLPLGPLLASHLGLEGDGAAQGTSGWSGWSGGSSSSSSGWSGGGGGGGPWLTRLGEAVERAIDAVTKAVREATARFQTAFAALPPLPPAPQAAMGRGRIVYAEEEDEIAQLVVGIAEQAHIQLTQAARYLGLPAERVVAEQSAETATLPPVLNETTWRRMPAAAHVAAHAKHEADLRAVPAVPVAGGPVRNLVEDDVAMTGVVLRLAQREGR